MTHLEKRLVMFCAFGLFIGAMCLGNMGCETIKGLGRDTHDAAQWTQDKLHNGFSDETEPLPAFE